MNNNLIEAWGNYYFRTSNDDTARFFKVTRTFAIYTVYENIVDDIEKLVFEGTLDECVSYCENQGAQNYDPLANFR